MGHRLTDEFDVLLQAVDTIEGEMARDVLDQAGIPSMLHGPDFDVAELGFSGHTRVRRADLLVPRGTRAVARQLLVDAWGEDVVRHHDPVA